MMCCCRPKNASSGTPDAVSNVAGPAAAVNRSNAPRRQSRNLVGESASSRVPPGIGLEATLRPATLPAPQKGPAGAAIRLTRSTGRQRPRMRIVRGLALSYTWEEDVV
jgi:hypothetical protein